jgi:hypothetical protein
VKPCTLANPNSVVARIPVYCGSCGDSVSYGEAVAQKWLADTTSSHEVSYACSVRCRPVYVKRVRNSGATTPS